MKCPSDEKINSFVLGEELTTADRDQIAKHLENCEKCSKKVSMVKAIIAVIKDTEPPPEIFSKQARKQKPNQKLLKRICKRLNIQPPAMGK